MPNCGEFVECVRDIVSVLCRVMWCGELWAVCGVYWVYLDTFEICCWRRMEKTHK